MLSPGNVGSMVARFELLGTPQDGFDRLGSLPQVGESWNKELKRKIRTIRSSAFDLSLINLPGQCEAVIDDEDEDDEDMPQLVSSS